MQIWQPNQTIKNGRFLIRKKIGVGGFGITYLADDTATGQQVVIKTLNAERQEEPDFREIQEKFVNEALKLSQFRHPHIVRVQELIQEGALWGIVMEYIDGMELSDYLLERGKLTESEAVGYIDRMAQALDYVHQQGVLHRDIKPNNIMLRQSDRQPILIDFGLAREFIDGKTLSMTNALTHGYAPIEQYDRQGQFGAYTDVYALAATLYHLLTGQAPIPANYLEQPGVKLPDPKSYNSTISKGVNRAIMQSMALDFRLRPQNMSEFRSLLGLAPISGSPAPGAISTTARTSPTRFNRRKILKWAGFGSLGLLGALIWLGSTEEPPKKASKPILKTIQFNTIKLDKKGAVVAKPEHKVRVFQEDLGNGVAFEVVEIPAGNFLMGQTNAEKQELIGQLGNDLHKKYYISELPQHRVNLKAFYMGQKEVTQAVYREIMGDNPAKFQGDDLPIDNISWRQAQEFCEKLSQRTGRNYTLPSESQWEYACRGGTSSSFYTGDNINTDLANYDGSSSYGDGKKGLNRQKTTKVASFVHNPFGLYDMTGNVWEWCLDTWHDDYKDAPTDGSAWRSNIDSEDRVLRGGSWNFNPWDIRSALRYKWAVDSSKDDAGLRVVLAID